ncbi:MAG: hypothetical protein ACR2MP_18985 [Streptosporangiaceae bacterium]
MDLVVEAVTYAGLLLTRDPVVAALLLAFLSANLAVFSSVGVTLRQSLAPPGCSAGSRAPGRHHHGHRPRLARCRHRRWD